MGIRRYYTDMVDRAVRTAAQAAIAVLGADVVDVLNTDWVGVVSVAAGGAVLSILTTVTQRGISGRQDV